MESYQYPAAHFGHLNDQQEEALQKFKQICQERGYYFSRGQDGRGYASHDDETLLRYLRARKFNPDEGFQQFKDTEDWRKENHLEEYYDKVDINEYDAARKLYPQWTGRRDRRGIPVYLFEVAHLNSKNISDYESSLSDDKSPALNPNSKVPPKMMRLFALYENLTRFVLPLCSAIKDRPHTETPVSQSNNIVDISGVGLRQFWNLKSHMQDASTLATAHYPETLDRIFIIGAPSFFPTVWSWIKRWFDPITVSKIFILSEREVKPTLEKYIEPQNIPRKYGGTLDFKFGMMPVLEPAIIDALYWNNINKSKNPVVVVKEKVETVISKSDISTTDKVFPIGPIKWHEDGDGKLNAIAVGSYKGNRRDDIIAHMKADIAFIHGISRQNTTVDWSLEKVISTSGTATQPQEGDPDYGKDLLNNPSGTATPLSAALSSSDNDANAQAPSTAAPTDLSFAESKSPSARAPIAPSSGQPRTGTSATAFAAQAGTAAEGTMARDTPHVVDFGHGDKAAVMEPATVGQARKEVLVVRDGPEAPSVVEQAKSAVAGVSAAAGTAASSVSGAVGSVAGNVLNAVGLGGQKEEDAVVEEAEKDKAKDETPLDIKDEAIEGYIRDKNSSKVPNLPPSAKPAE